MPFIVIWASKCEEKVYEDTKGSSFRNRDWELKQDQNWDL